MKALRRLGKKFKKGFKKLFSSKIGRIIGTIGLSMAMGAAARALIGAVAAPTATTAITETAAGVAASDIAAEQVATSILKKPLIETITKETLAKPVIEELAKPALKELTAIPFTQAGSNVEVASNAFNIIDAQTAAGTNVTNIQPSITKAVENVIENTPQFQADYGIGTEYYQRNIPSDFFETTVPYTEAVPSTMTTPSVGETIELYDPVQGRLEAGIDPKTLAEKLSATGDFTGAVPPSQEPSLLEQDTFVKAHADTYREPAPKRGPQGGPLEEQTWAEGFKEQFGKGDIAADVIKGTVTGSLMAMVEGEPDEPFYSKGVAPLPTTEPPQAAYMTAIEPYYLANMNKTIMPAFPELQKENLYGTGTLQNLQAFALPSLIGLPLIGTGMQDIVSRVG